MTTTQPPPPALTMREIAALEKMLRDNPDDAAGYLMNDGERLLAMARRLLELEGAAAAIRDHSIMQSGRYFADPLDQLLEQARELGWRPEGGESDGNR
jgi:hypothetical protein